MRFHGFASVDAWLAEFPKLKDYPWQVTKQYLRRTRPDPMWPHDGVVEEAMPYGDPVTDIRKADPERVMLVMVTGSTRTAAVSGHLFAADGSAYFAFGEYRKLASALTDWGFTPEEDGLFVVTR